MVMEAVYIHLYWLGQSLISFIPYFIGGLLAGSIVLASSVFLARYLLWQWLLPAEKGILLTLKSHGNPLLDAWMKSVTFLAQGQVTIPLLIFSASLLVYLQQFTAALILAINLSGSWLLNGIFKSFFRRQRPDLWASPNRPMDYSYPSGHSMSAISFYGLLAFYATHFLSIPLSITLAIAISISILVGFSRVYLGVHWPTDVFSGWMAGIIWLMACLYGLVNIGAI